MAHHDVTVLFKEVSDFHLDAPRWAEILFVIISNV